MCRLSENVIFMRDKISFIYPISNQYQSNLKHDKKLAQSELTSLLFTYLFSIPFPIIDILHRAELTVPLLNIRVGHIQIRLLGNGHTVMAQYLTERIDIHPGHQTSFSKVIPECMRRHMLLDPAPLHISESISAKLFV